MHSFAKLLGSLCAAWLVTQAHAAPPNILFAIADDWSPHAGAYGTKWVNTPVFDRVAKEGLLFQHAYTPNAKCAPSRASLLTGRNPWQLEDAANHLCYFPAKFKGWGEALAENGWFVGYTAKGWGPGVAKDAAGKTRLMTGAPYNRRQANGPTSEISKIDYASNFKDFLDEAPSGKPWCFWYGSYEPHRGYEFGSGMAKGGKQLADVDRVPAFWPDNTRVRKDLLDYAFEVEHFDRQLGRMIAELEHRGMLENTLIIVTSDHGMPFPRAKGNAGELPNHVPLAMMWKGGVRQPGRKIEDFVSFVDFAPTIVELAGLKWNDTGLAESSGRSFTDILYSEKSGYVNAARDSVLIGKERTDVGRPYDQGYPIRGIVTADSVYLQNFEPSRWPAGNPETGYMDCDAGATKSAILYAHRQNPNDESWAHCFGKLPAEQLYDLKTDPDCIKNLAEGPQASSQLSTLRAMMHEKLKLQGDPRMEGRGFIFDSYRHSVPGHANYYERFMAGEELKAGWISPTDIDSLKPKAPVP